MNNKQLISNNIERFYTKASEETRLEKGMGVFEFERIKSLIEKYIAPANATIVDVGGGTGKYAEWLANKGHQVNLVEPVAKHIKTATARAAKLKNKFTVHQGEARNLPFPSNYADLIILHGPLYHLQKKEERVQTILEASQLILPTSLRL